MLDEVASSPVLKLAVKIQFQYYEGNLLVSKLIYLLKIQVSFDEYVLSYLYERELSEISKFHADTLKFKSGNKSRRYE